MFHSSGTTKSRIVSKHHPHLIFKSLKSNLLSKRSTMSAVIFLFLFIWTAVSVAKCQVIRASNCQVRNNFEHSIMTIVREMQLQLSSFQQKTLESSRVLNDRLVKIETELSSYRDQSLEKENKITSTLDETNQRLDETEEKFNSSTSE